MRMPVAAQRASIPVFLCAGGILTVVMGSRPWGLEAWVAEQGCSATTRRLRQVAPHQKRVQMFPAGLLVITFAAADDAESGPFIQPSRRLIVFFHFQKDGADAAAGKVAEMGQEQVARQAAPALIGIDRDRENFG